jgi:hypothetical protein
MQSIKSIADLLKFRFRRIPAPVEFEEQPPAPSADSSASGRTVPFWEPVNILGVF